MERLILLRSFLNGLAISHHVGIAYRKRVQDHPELQLLEKQIVQRFETTTVSPLKNLLCEEFLATLCHRDPLATTKCFFWLFLSYLTFLRKGMTTCPLASLSLQRVQALMQRLALLTEDRKGKPVLVELEKTPKIEKATMVHRRHPYSQSKQGFSITGHAHK